MKYIVRACCVVVIAFTALLKPQPTNSPIQKVDLINTLTAPASEQEFYVAMVALQTLVKSLPEMNDFTNLLTQKEKASLKDSLRARLGEFEINAEHANQYTQFWISNGITLSIVTAVLFPAWLKALKKSTVKQHAAYGMIVAATAYADLKAYEYYIKTSPAVTADLDYLNSLIEFLDNT